jgi:DNA polymerase-3 subunit gamma/tau
VLAELLLALHRIALAQADPALAGEDGAGVLTHAQALSPEDVQLYYQIGVLGRRDLGYAPDVRTGLQMTLLRMLAFRPESASAARVAPGAPASVPVPARPVAKSLQPAPLPKQVEEPAPRESPPSELTPEGWSDAVGLLGLAGLARELANNTTLASFENGQVQLVLDEACAQLRNKDREMALKQALERLLRRDLRLEIRVGAPARETPAKERQRLQTERQRDAEQAIDADPTVQALKEKFNARVSPGSVRPKI